MASLEDLKHVAESQDAHFLAEKCSELVLLDDLLPLERGKTFLVWIGSASHVELDILFDLLILKDHLNLSLSSQLIKAVVNDFNTEHLLLEVFEREVVEALLNLIELVDLILGLLNLLGVVLDLSGLVHVLSEVLGPCVPELVRSLSTNH